MRSSADLRAFVRPASEVPDMGSQASARQSSPQSVESALAAARLAGFKEGRREGLELGVLEGRTLGQESVASVVHALQSAAEQLQNGWETTVTEIEELATALAVELAEEILGREITASPEPGSDALRRAMRLRADHEPVRARLHPDDAAMIAAGLPADVTVVPDPTVARGDALVELGDGLVDASVSAALARAREALR